MFNQLKEYRNTKGTTATYEYLPNNYRYSKTVGSTTTRFLWDGDYVAGELNSSGEISTVYFYGLDMLSDTSGNNYVYDIHGSITNVLNSSGTKTSTYDYNAFGRDVTDSGTSNPWQYCGEYKDGETGLIYLRNRYYDPETGRFINEDPIRSGGNWYSYAGQNPVVFIDPSGLEYNSLRTLVKSTADALGCSYEIKTDDKNNKVTVTIGEGTYDISGTFYYDGTAEMDSENSREKIAVNDNGTLKMERTDFYSAIGIQNESSMTTENNRGIIKKSVSLVLGTITSAATSVFIKDPKTDIVVGLIVGEVTAKILDYTMDDVGDYKKITTVGEVYNKKTGLYESIVTKDDYKLGPNNGEYAYYRDGLTTEKDDYTYVTSIFDNTVY